jgi:endonuclease/exonuclease/phosphatase family metal-dependent hydrolase
VQSHDIGARIRVATYNIHKCRGLDRLVRPGRIVEVLRKIDADIIALQEVLSFEAGDPEKDQFRYIATELGYHAAFGENRRLKSARYGNVVLSRFPIHVEHNYDITRPGREPRGCLRADVRINGIELHVFNVHFGTAFREHRQQARHLFEEQIVNHVELRGTRIVLGDFNEWLRGDVSRTFKAHLDHADIRHHLKRSRSYPGVFPLLQLDHIFHDRTLQLQRLHLYRGRPALIASDHLPLIADFAVPAALKAERPGVVGQ